MDQQTPDWEALERLVQRQRRPVGPVKVAYRDVPPVSASGEWYGDGMAVVLPTYKDYPTQLIHIPTGLWMQEHPKPVAVRALALALQDVLDWATIDERGVVAHASQPAVVEIVRSWHATYDELRVAERKVR